MLVYAGASRHRSMDGASGGNRTPDISIQIPPSLSTFDLALNREVTESYRFELSSYPFFTARRTFTARSTDGTRAVAESAAGDESDLLIIDRTHRGCPLCLNRAESHR